MRVSLRQVATRARVSECTASHVVNSHPKARVGYEARQRVLEAVAELGYRPNRLARSLGRRRTDSIGLLISGLRNPFFVEVLENAETVALAAGYQVFVDASPSVGGTYLSHSKLRDWPVDGVLIWARPWETLADSLGSQAAETPHVYLGYTSRTDGAPMVGFDLYEGGRMAARHVVSVGRGRIAYATPYEQYELPDDRFREPRLQAYYDVCGGASLPTQVLVLPGNEETRAAGFAMGSAVATQPEHERPDAILCLNDIVAVGLCAGLRRAGIKVPEDIAVVGFDGIEEAKYQTEPLTTIATPADELCRRAFDLLMRAMSGEDLTGTRVVVPVRFIKGGTA